MRYPTFIIAAGAAALVAAQPAAAATAHAKQFLTEAMKGDNSESMLGKLAAHQGASASVRSFGFTLVTDHSKAKAQAAHLARALGVAVPDAVMPEARQERTKLEKMHGVAFDQEFARYMVSDHQKDIAKFDAEAKTGDGPVAQLASRQLPTLRKHLGIAQRLAGK